SISWDVFRVSEIEAVPNGRNPFLCAVQGQTGETFANFEHIAAYQAVPVFVPGINSSQGESHLFKLAEEFVLGDQVLVEQLANHAAECYFAVRGALVLADGKQQTPLRLW